MSNRLKLASAAYFGLAARQVNVSCKQVSPIKTSGVIPGGFPYSAFNGGAKVRPDSMMHMVETVRGVVFNINHFVDADKIYQKEQLMLFINASTMQVDKRLYDFNIPKGPLRFEAELDSIGKTSSQIKTSFYVEEVPEPVLVSRVSSVFICQKKRVPRQPPDWWVDKYKSLIGEDNASNSIGRLEFSEGDESQATECDFRVCPSDCDSYRHTNWSHYIRYCHDAFGQHREAKLGDEGFEEYFQRGIRCFSIRYQNESSAGDLLTVKTSPARCADDKDNVFYFHLVNQSKVPVCQGKIEYYPEDVSQ